jgi:hypothetical protein
MRLNLIEVRIIYTGCDREMHVGIVSIRTETNKL